MLSTPVAFLIFNRPELTKTIFAEIAKVKPKKLLVVADGPRQDKQGEAEKCAAARAVIEQVDWDCEVLKNYSDENLGCGIRVATGIDWVFEHVDEAIILEDDCLPHLTFFEFCSELLEKYRDDERVMMISGSNLMENWKSDIQSYHFSYYGGIWGWASWKRAWKYYDYHMKLWKHESAVNCVRNVLVDPDQYMHREEIFSKTFRREIDTWDSQWSLARLLQSGLSVVPSVNLVSNIGFGRDATHTFNLLDSKANLPLSSMSFPLRQSCGLAVDREYDYNFYLKVSNNITNKNNLFQRLSNKVKNLLRLSEIKNWLNKLFVKELKRKKCNTDPIH